MGLTHYLAMTGAEFRRLEEIPPHPAWMACHFSPYGLGLSNLPKSLPPGALLILDDVTPIRGHDPALIASQLQACLEAFDCSAVLLDFQRREYEETGDLVSHLTAALPCPVGVSEGYSGGLDYPVFLPPPPCSAALREYLAPWAGREVWLETSLGGEAVTVTETGASLALCPGPAPTDDGFPEDHLHCHYTIESGEDAATFRFWRTEEDLRSLLSQAEALGVTLAVGLYQELGDFRP